MIFGWVVAGAALWKGAWPERAVAVAFLVTWIGTALTRTQGWVGFQGGPFLMDVALFVATLVVALRSRRFWPMFAAGFQLLAVIVHGARLVDSNVGTWAYVTAGIIFTYLFLYALAFGTWGAFRERRQLANAGAPIADPGPTLR